MDLGETLDARQAGAIGLRTGMQQDWDLGKRLIESGALTYAQLADAVEQQAALAELGERFSLGAVLVALRYVTAEQVVEFAPEQWRVHWLEQAKARGVRHLAARLTTWLRRATGRSV